MKVTATIAAASMAIAAASADADTTSRQLILGGSIIPSGQKTYSVGIRSTAGGDTYCGGALISPTHVLTTTMCTKHAKPDFVAVGTHYVNGTKDGEQLKVIQAQNHTDFNKTGNGEYDFALLTLEKPSKFAPVKLPKADDSDIKPGMWSKAMGWGWTSFPNGSPSNEMQGVNLQVWSNEDCSQVYVINPTNVCAGGVAGKDACVADTGGPLIKENGAGDKDDVLIGLVNWGYGCGDEGAPTVYSRVSSALKWVNPIISAK
ncbi:serine protease trypsin-like protein [Phytophthora sojae]|uniref:Serine protease trypsin-like protein n=1 Tax=Phytophthora sojae (strain P6497) TaxID=1094619 RepID=G5AE37_PHYSP|nr:serine protease trypsin-like protein [Phytophthora sojae]EGZ06439.1 serine protease trypsin-like protein [Phytophthora sojae]|eukprot:XP_009538336.1 serine protease trypsin-like protein [Phytophthora sojae]